VLLTVSAVCGCSLIVDPIVDDGSGPNEENSFVNWSVQPFEVDGVAVPGGYDLFDSNQGTVSFYVTLNRPAKASGNHEIFGGPNLEIRIAERTGTITVHLAEQSTVVELEGAAQDWAVGDEHFVAVRWDLDALVSPLEEGARAFLHVDGVRVGAITSVLTPDPVMRPVRIMVDGAFSVSKLQVHRRPLFESSSGIGELADRKLNAGDNNERLGGGPWDVSLASHSSIVNSATPAGVSAWSFSSAADLLDDGRLHGDFAAATPWSGTLVPIAEHSNEIFNGAGVELLSTEFIEQTITPPTSRSMVAAALIHTEGTATASLNLRVADDKMSTMASAGSSSERPQLLVLAWEDSTHGVMDAVVGVHNEGAGGKVFVHWLMVAENLLDVPSFEVEAGTPPPPWESVVPFDVDEVSNSAPWAMPHGGAVVIAVEVDGGSATDTPHSIQQAPRMLDGDGIYVAGAFIIWNDISSGVPSISAPSRALLGIHADPEPDEGVPVEMRAELLSVDGGWQHLSVVGKRMGEPGADNVAIGNDGSGAMNSSFGIDTTYVVKPRSVPPGAP